MYAQAAGGAGVGVAGLCFGLLDVGKDLFAAQQVALAGFGEGDAPGGAVEQAGPQVGLQIGNRAGYVGGGGVQLLRGGGETAGFRDTGERTHRLQCVHWGLVSGASVPGGDANEAIRRRRRHVLDGWQCAEQSGGGLLSHG